MSAGVQPGALYVVSTPIGNLGDITLRAIQILGQVDFVICEDTRHSGKLLAHLKIKKPLRSFHDHTPDRQVRSLAEELKGGSCAAFVTDAGTPLISDPGFKLLREAFRLGVRVEAIPGPSAFVNALVLSGLPTHEFTFLGYLAQKVKKRNETLQRLASEQRTLIFYESPYRVVATLEAMLEFFGDREASVSREMTKKFEETIRGKLSELVARLKDRKIVGEWTIVVDRHR